MYNITWDTNYSNPDIVSTMTGGAKTNIDFLMSLFGLPSSIIEVGCFEGNTTLWMSDNITPLNPNLKIYSIDPHKGSIDMLEDGEEIHNRFVSNLELNTHKNIEYIRKDSDVGLIELYNRNVKAELIYIDGDHRSDTVLSDLVLSFKLLHTGGVILCDDTGDWQYEDKNKTKAVQMSPRLAVEMFIACNWQNIRPIVLPNAGQTAIQKIC
jgi:predicted O-methyltransferase YrrM